MPVSTSTVVVKFSDDLGLPYVDGVERFLDGPLGVAWQSIAAFVPVSISRAFTADSPERIAGLLDTARAWSGEDVPNLLAYFTVECPDLAVAETVVNALAVVPGVESVYVEAEPQDAAVDPTGETFFAEQRHLFGAPGGIDAVSGWREPGGDGTGVLIYDVEYNWKHSHLDFAGKNIPVIGTPDPNQPLEHGTMVLGVLIAQDNGFGCVGIVPRADVRTVSALPNLRDAILAATMDDSVGYHTTVILLEQQLPRKFLVDTTTTQEEKLLPVEAEDALAAAIEVAVKSGQTVVEAAGNGGVDLDRANLGGRFVFDRLVRDTGAIMVGAGSHARRRLAFSNFGTRVDCFAHGELVRTTSVAFGQDSFVQTFGGTSSAAAIVAGAAAALQGIAIERTGFALTPRRLREVLSNPNANTPSDPPGDFIGVMPNIAAAQALI